MKQNRIIIILKSNFFDLFKYILFFFFKKPMCKFYLCDFTIKIILKYCIKVEDSSIYSKYQYINYHD